MSWEDPENLLRELVAARSPNPPGDERAAAAVIEDVATGLGLPRPERMACRPERPNLLFHLGSGPPRLLIAAHMDTMPPGDTTAWESDPYELTLTGDRLVGLGSADMKGAIVAMLHAGARLQQQPPAQGSVTLAFTADEETGSSEGMGWLCDQGAIVADAAMMAEPAGTGESSWEALFVAQRGSCVAELVAGGTPGHSGEPVPAEERAGAALASGMRALLDADPFPDAVHEVDGTAPTVNVGTMISGGEVPFVHPSELRATIEVRVLSGMSEEMVMSGLEGVIADSGLADRVRIEPRAGTSWIAPGESVSDRRLLDAAFQAWRSVIGAVPCQRVFPAGTDSSLVDALGIPTLPALGPGTLAVAHRPNESLPRSDLPLAIDMLEEIARGYLNRGP